MKKNSAAVLFALSILLVISPVTSSAEEDREGYWELAEVRHELKHFNEELVDKDYWSDSMSGSAGTGNFTSTYVGPTEDDDYAPRPKNGESGTVTGSVSTPPQYIDGGKTVKLSVDLSVTSTKQHFFDFNGDAYARFDETDVPIGHVTYSAIDFTAKDPDGEKLELSVWLYGPTNWRVKEYGNNSTVNTEVSAQAPYGSEEGEEISIYTQIGMGNMSSRTEYVYRWHAEGKAPAAKKTRDGKGSPLTWLIPAGILVSGGSYVIIRRKKRPKKRRPNDRSATPEVLKTKRDMLKEIADEGNDYAGKLSHEYNEMLKSSEWNGGRISPHREEKLKKLNDLFKKFMRGDVGHENEAMDELSRLENETSGGRFRRNLQRWKEIAKQGTLATVEEAAKGDSAKSIVFRAGIGTLTGGHSEVVFAPAESFYTMKDAVESGKSIREAAEKAYRDLAIDCLVGKATDIGISPTEAGKAGRFFVDMNNNKMLEFGEKIVTEAYSNGMKSTYDMAKEIGNLNTTR